MPKSPQSPPHLWLVRRPAKYLQATCAAHASLLLEAGVHRVIVQERLGHSQVSVTLDTYSHVAPSLQREAAGRIDELL